MHLKLIKGSEPALTRLDHKFENIFFEIHSVIRDVDGLHDDEALDELCKIISCKIYDEFFTQNGEAYKLQRGLYDDLSKFDYAIRELFHLVKASQPQDTQGSSFRLSVPALTKSVELLQGYDLSGSATDIKGRAFQKVLSKTMRSGLGQFFTPHQVAVMMAEILSPKGGESILDPFCGSAHFLTTCKAAFEANNNDTDTGTDIELYGIEKSDRMARIASADIQLYGENSTNITNADALLSFDRYQGLSPASFDIVITNPPFGSLLTPDSVDYLGDFELFRHGSSAPLEILGLERSVQFLKPGGKIGIVIPEGILTNRNTRYVRDWIEKNLKIRVIVSLPIETFSPFGASVKTNVLFATKYMPGETRENYSIELIEIENVGHDASGKPKKSDVEQAVTEARKFINAEGW